MTTGMSPGCTPGDDDRTWRDDLATEMIHDYLSRAVAAAAREEIDRPHIVVCRDPESGAVSYSGPYPDGLSALLAAEREAEIEALEYGVATLFPAVVDGGAA